jgi:basic membrane protein A
VRQTGTAFDWTQREPDVFVASAVADSGGCVAQAIADHRAGALALGALVRARLECTDAVRLALHRSVPPAVRARVGRRARRLLDGRVEPSATFDDATWFVPRGA